MGIPSVKTIKAYLALDKTHLGEKKAATIVRQAMEWAESGADEYPKPTLEKYFGEFFTSADFGHSVYSLDGVGTYAERIHRALMIIDKATEGFGVEYIPAEDDTYYEMTKGVEYVNQGDTYTATVYYDHGTEVWHVGDWGTVVENNPDRFPY